MKRRVTDTKPSNPKAAIGETKIDMGLMPDTAVLYGALAFTEGATKYGRYNWRVAGVRASTYRSALQRHLVKWWNGEWADPITGVPHLANAIACLSILIDAHESDMLNDDRPPSMNIAKTVDSMTPRIAHLKELLKEHNPTQFNITHTRRTRK